MGVGTEFSAGNRERCAASRAVVGIWAGRGRAGRTRLCWAGRTRRGRADAAVLGAALGQQRRSGDKRFYEAPRTRGPCSAASDMLGASLARARLGVKKAPRSAAFRSLNLSGTPCRPAKRGRGQDGGGRAAAGAGRNPGYGRGVHLVPGQPRAGAGPGPDGRARETSSNPTRSSIPAKPRTTAEMSYLSGEGVTGDSMSSFSPSGSGVEESLGLLDDYLEVAMHFRPNECSRDKVGSSEWLAVDGMADTAGQGTEDAFSGTDWMVEKIDLKGFDFDSLFSLEDMETMPDELLATLDDTCDLFEPLAQETNKEPLQAVNPIGHLPESLLQTDQVAPFTFLQPLPQSPEALVSTPDHSFHLELGSEVDISEGDRKADTLPYVAVDVTVVPQCIKEEEAPSDNDSGICMSPESYLGSPQHSPPTSGGSPNKSVRSTAHLGGSARAKPYDPRDRAVVAKIKAEKLDKKLKKMEQNKTAATKYRQKKRAEQEALTGECKELEKKNESLKEKADSLAKEIQYLKDLIEEVRRARGKKRIP
ncbi:cyclic AMP-dependent transcription factor ATF-4 [Rhynchocyon petersi]